MAQQLRPIPKTAKIFSFIVFMAIECLGLLYIITQHVHFGAGKSVGSQPHDFYGKPAVFYGIGLLILGVMPLILFAKNTTQIILVGTFSAILGVGLMIYSSFI